MVYARPPMAEPQGSTEKRGGSYEVHAEIGAGGMATVHLGQLVGARGFSRTVAIKVLHASYAKNKEFVSRFLDEARLVARIHHPNVMPTLDVIAEGDDLRIVMEYVAGESLDRLQARMRERGEQIPARVACAIIAGALHGLHAAHEAKNEFGEPLGIVHLDISPQNILVGTDGTTRVLDFGVARAKGDRVDPAVGGKSAYLAPEQVRGTDVSPRTDVFAASIVLWELLTGTSLFAADNHAATLQRVLAAEIPPPSQRVPAIPARLDEVLRIGLEREPARRFATARAMALELERAVAPALPSEVGRWVEAVAEATLVARAAKVQEMESHSARRPEGTMAELVPTREMYAEQAAVNLPEDALEDADTGSLLRAPGGKDPLVPRRAEDGSIRWQPRTARPAVEGAASGARPDRAARPSAASPTAPPRPRPDAAPRPDVAGRRKLIAIGVGGTTVVLAVLAVGARVLLLPGYVQAAAVTAAAAHGVTLTVTDASLSNGSVTLRGLTAKLAGVEQATCTIASAEVQIRGLSPNRVALGKLDVTVDGDAPAVLQALEGWAAAHRAKATARGESDVTSVPIDVPAAHFLWRQPAGQEVTRVEATAVRGTISALAAGTDGDELHLLTEALVVEARGGTFGPWSINVDVTAKGTRARLAFDPAVPDGANALLVSDTLGHASLELSVPKMATTSLGIPRTALGPDVTLPQQLEIALHYSQLSNELATGTLRAAFYGVRVPELGTTVDARLSGDAAGPQGGPMTVKNGLFSVGGVRATVTGTLTAGDRAVKGNLAWKAEPVPCANLVSLPTPAAAARDLHRKAADGDLGDLGELARDFGALGQAVGAVRVTGTFTASGTVAFNSTSLGQAKFTTVAKNACGIALFQGK